MAWLTVVPVDFVACKKRVGVDTLTPMVCTVPSVDSCNWRRASGACCCVWGCKCVSSAHHQYVVLSGALQLY